MNKQQPGWGETLETTYKAEVVGETQCPWGAVQGGWEDWGSWVFGTRAEDGESGRTLLWTLEEISWGKQSEACT